MSQWVPKSITSDPISCLIDSQILEDAFLPAPPPGPKPVPASPIKTNSLTDSPSQLSLIEPQSTSILTNLSPTKSIKEISSTQTLSSSASLDTSIKQPITTISASSNNKAPALSIESQALLNTSNGLSIPANQKDVDMLSEDNSTKLFVELQPRGTIPILRKSGDQVSEVNLDQSSVIKEIKSMEISDNKTINKLWKLPDSGKISNPYFEGKRDVDANNASTSSNEKKSNRKTMDDGPKRNAKENNSHAKNVRFKNDTNSIPFIEIDSTDSVNTPSTTDESDDSLNNDRTKVNGIKKKRRARKQVMKKEMYKDDQDQIDASSAISKPEKKSETIPGLDSPQLTTTIEEINEAPTDETINNEQKQSQASSDNFVKPMETNSTPTKVNTPTDTIKKEATLPTVAATVTNETSTEIQQQDDPPQSTDKPKCIKIGCCNSAIEHIDWDFEYCSSRCAFEHCKTAFANWVTSRQLESGNSTTPAPTPPTVTTTSAN